MRELAAAILLPLALAGCASSSTAASSPAAPAATSPATSASPAATRCTMQPTQDLIAWYRAPGVHDSALLLGDADLSNCRPTVDTWQAVSPTNPGYCSALAKATDNPGYNIDADPAPRPKKIIVEYGPAC